MATIIRNGRLGLPPDDEPRRVTLLTLSPKPLRETAPERGEQTPEPEPTVPAPASLEPRTKPTGS